MAIKIPDAPNVIGTQPVLRQPDSINARFETPNFKVDVSDAANAVKNVGDAYASFVEQQTETLMGAACNQFSHDVMQEEESLKANNKGIYANDLYARLEKKATAVLDDITGDPKDDGRVRIANPELRKRFRDWASRQMPAYQARMTHYTASELDKANKVILEDGIKQVNNMVANATTTEELMAAREEYIRGARLSASGMPKEYQMAEAARLMDEALLNKMSTMAKTDVLGAINLYMRIPEIGAGMSGTSEAAFWKTMQDNFNEQGGSRTADRLDGENPMVESGGFTDPNIVKYVFPNATPAEVERIITDVKKKGLEIHSATKEAKRGQAEKEYAALQSKIVNTDITNADAMSKTALDISAFDKDLADQFVRDAQTQLYESAVMNEYEKQFPFGDEAMEAWKSTGRKQAEESWKRAENKYINDMWRYRTEMARYRNGEISEEPVMPVDEREGYTRESYISAKQQEFLSAYQPDSLEQGMASVLGQDTAGALFNRSIDLEPRVLTPEQSALLAEQRRIVAKNTQWINNPVYARMYAEAIDGRYHGEPREELNDCPFELKKNLASVVEINRRFNEVVEANPKLKDDIKNALPKKKKDNPYFVASVQREVVKAMDRYSRDPAHHGSYPVKDSIEYNNIVNQAIQNAVSPTEARVGAYLNEQQIDLLQKAKIDPYLNPGASISKLKENKILPNEAVVLLNNDYKAEEIADAIIDTASGAKKRTLEMYRDSMIQSIETTGNYDGWFMFADGIGQ